MKLHHVLFSPRLRDTLLALLRVVPARSRARVRYAVTVPAPLRTPLDASTHASTLGAAWTIGARSQHPECAWRQLVAERARVDAFPHRAATGH